MSTIITPDIGSYGTFELDDPFKSQLTAGVAYECISLRSLDDIAKLGSDPFALYYTPNSLSQDKFNQDKAAGVLIATLRSKSGSYVYVPTSFIKSYPRTGGVPYHILGLVLNLGAIPKNLDLTLLKSVLTDVVQSYLGVSSQANEVILSDETLLSAASDQALTAARQAKITATESDHAAKLRLEAANTTLTAKVRELETYILNLPKPQ